MTLDNSSLPIRELVTSFESLGDNCELGIVQRSYGAEPLGLLRWAGINHIDMLIKALNERFIGLGDPENVAHEVLAGWDHHAAIDKKFGFYFHTDLNPSAVADQPENIEKTRLQEGRRLRFLAANLMNVLQTGEKVLVYRQKRSLEPGQIDRLFEAISRIGCNTLMIVIEDQLRTPGTVEIVKHGLLFAYVRRLSNENPPQIDFEAWEQIIVNAHTIWKRLQRDVRHLNLVQVPLRGIFDKPLTVAPDSILASFESLGHGCEFGIAQRFVGIEPLGLFRFSTLPHSALVMLLKNQFSDITDASELRLEADETLEYFACIDRYGIRYHTGAYSTRLTEAEVLAREQTRLGFYKRKILEDITSSEKIFVRFDNEVSESQVIDLFQLLNTYGKNRLFWIDTATDDRSVGTIEQISSGLIRGFVRGRSGYATPDPEALANLITISFDARELLGREQNLNSIAARGNWMAPKIAIAEISREVDPGPRGKNVFKHTLLEATTDQNAETLVYEVRFDMRREALYTISAWVWVPSSFAGLSVAMVASGFASLRGWVADLSRRDEWQRIATSFRQPSNHSGAAPTFRVVGPAGSVLFTTGWRLDEGGVPADYFL